MDRLITVMSKIRIAQTWEVQVFKALDCSFLDAILKTVLRIMMYNRTSNSESKAIEERANT